MKDKRGEIFGENTVNIILAVVVAVVLIGVIGRVYYESSTDHQEESVINILGKIDAKIKALDAGEETSLLVQGFQGSEDWKIFAWGKNDPGRADACFLESCVCMCKTEEDCLPRLCRLFSDFNDVEVRGDFIPGKRFVTGTSVPAGGFVSDSSLDSSEEFITLSTNLLEIEISKVESGEGTKLVIKKG